MALSEDQKAMLRLLAQRGEEGYEDLSALMGIGAADVYAKALAAAARLESEGIPAPAIPPPPGASAAAGEPKLAEPASESPEPEPVEGPPAPAPEPPKAEKAPPPPTPKPPAATPAAAAPRPELALPKSGGARAALAAGALVVVALVVILVVGGGDSDNAAGVGSGGTGAGEAVNTGGAKEVTQAVLAPVGGGDASGVATFGRLKNSLALQVEAVGLEPTGDGESYTIWLYESPRKMLPLASTRVGSSGKIGAQVEVPVEVLGYLANETFDQIDVSLTTDAALKASLEKATAEKKAPIYTGTDVLRGPIRGPIIGAAR